MAQVIKADLDELVFRSKNKDYGSYVLRKTYLRNTVIGLIMATILALLVVLMPAILALFESAPEQVEAPPVRKITYSELSEPPPINEDRPPPPPPDVALPPPPKKAQVQFVPPEIVEEEDPEDDNKLITQDELNRENFAITNTATDTEGLSADGLFLDGIAEGVGDGPAEVQEQPGIPDPNAFVAVEKEPAPVNMDNVKREIGYPETARQASLEGSVVMRIYVDKFGAYQQHIVLSSSSPTFTRAVEQHINKLRFTPGIQAGQPIGVWVNIPFTFKLNQ